MQAVNLSGQVLNKFIDGGNRASNPSIDHYKNNIMPGWNLLIQNVDRLKTMQKIYSRWMVGPSSRCKVDGLAALAQTAPTSTNPHSEAARSAPGLQ
jgi:hypothetical protein